MSTQTIATLSSSQNPSASGANVIFTVVTSGGPVGAPAPNTVRFYDGVPPPGAGVLLGSATATSANTFVFATTALSVATHPIQAQFTNNVGPVNSNIVAQVVNAAAAANAVTVTSSLNPSVFGNNVTFTATTAGGTAPATVQFRDNGVNVGAAVTSATGNNVFTFSTANLTGGTHPITAQFTGAGTVTSPILNQVVNQNSATVATLTTSKSPSAQGETVTFTGFVTNAAPIAPTGTVTFSDTFNGQTTTLTTLALSSGQVLFPTNQLATGTHTISFTYSGDGNYTPGAFASVQQIVGTAGSSTAVSSSSNPAGAGQAVTFTARITNAGSANLTGNVTFNDGAAVIGVVPVANGEARLTVSNLTVGSHAISATYGNDANVSGSTGSITQVISPALSTTTVSSSSANSQAGSQVTFSAVVKVSAPGSGTATGNVTFKDGASTIGTVALDGNGVAVFKTSTLTPGNHTITASYAGDSKVTGSTSGSITQTVKSSVTTVTVATSPSPSQFGQAVTITATLDSPSGPPTGSVTFKNGAAILGTGALSAAGIATFTTTGLPVGTATLTVDYEGGLFPAGSGSVVHLVNKADTSIQLASTPNPSITGQAVTFTATINASQQLSGTAEIFVDDKSIGTFPVTNNSGTFSTTALANGPHTVRVTYSGNNQFNGAQSATITQTVNAAPGTPGGPPASSGGTSGSSGSSGASGGTSGSGVKPTPVTVGGSTADDEGCHVANVGSSTTSRMVSFGALALGLILAIRRRRRG